MGYISVDVESDGPNFRKNSMVCFGAVIIEPSLNKTFYGRVRPTTDFWEPEALSISGFSREEHLAFDDPFEVMPKFAKWINENSVGRPIFISDNNGYDFPWINMYFLEYNNSVNPFGWSSRRISDLFCGAEHDLYYKWKKYRKTIHSHDALDDCIGNAEALLYFFEKYRMKLPK